ncbi:endonuclease [Alcanivorax sp. S71-1-4]|jgi:putative endonuclease|uniref:GIY-YIG nuclease family protein n=1 Tax=Alcanivorax sp. S71-1-4 TaxID=1177159 RepID=UPI0016B1CC02|nr:GIY-YIG nuclease family protein [Alcanivorax sp. S71-1-4]KAF0809560.1 endonuclease [Alcanivorax sp. S71-1-4]
MVAKTPEMVWFVYILRCADASLYTGITNDLQRRVLAHNHDRTGARYTRARRPVELVWHEQHASRSDALRREAAIKRLSRAKKMHLLGAAGEP